MANNDSVAVGESETMRRGFLGTVTFPFEATIVTGNDACEPVWCEVAPPDAPATTTAKTAATRATRAEIRST